MVACFASDSLSPPNGERVGVRGKHLKIKVMKRHRPQKNVIMVAIPIIKGLPNDPEWEAVEARLTAHSNRKVAPFEE